MAKFSAQKIGRILAVILLSAVLGLLRNSLFPRGIEFGTREQTRASEDTLGLEIEVDQAFRLYQDSVRFIDARSPAEFKTSHISGAINIPAGASIEQKMQLTSSLEKSVKYVVYCNNPECPLGHQLYEYLQFAEFTNVHLMYEGIEGWESAGHPVTDTAEGDDG
ncbi:MAG: rhodanese-like domain-containing protein [Candidatus Marinimicrobia bacterium]|nr:rhodanese-like domain-containing protein [Candidatus Neomarinimicrobiota bacterium]MCF7828540.1 rhodanese-like domain-containing protein [Candidatus Neomarinimicrobiota bacterium]MCF7882037.1 rhodanese-like domain-containing protein [Candidatus Neomarinimicrobiota bacterium]